MKKIVFCCCVSLLSLSILTGCGEPAAQKEHLKMTVTRRQETALSEEELSDFEAWLDDVANNGFLRSFYEDIRQADLNEIFYNGAGLEQQPMTEELRRAYEAQAGEIMTDTIRLTTEQIDGFLKEKTGYGLAEFEHPLDWIYLEGYDVWMTEHGDTNLMDVACNSGIRMADGTLVLSCSVPGLEGYDQSTAFRVTLLKTDNGYRFERNETADVP